MKTVVFGKKIKNIYGVNHHWKTIETEDGDVKTVYTAKPILTKLQNTEWVEICSYDGEPRYNWSHLHSYFASSSSKKFNISEDETVSVSEEIFRVDLNEMHLRTDKIVEEIDIEKYEADINLSEQVCAFNEAMITSNEKLKSYCDIHKLSYGYTDAIELFGIVFPNKQYKIVDGVMKVKEKEVTITTSDYNTSTANTWCKTFSWNINAINELV